MSADLPRAPVNKMEIVALLAGKFPSGRGTAARYLELCTPTTGNYFHLLDGAAFAEVHRLMYRCAPDFDDGRPIDFRSEGFDIEPCLKLLHRQGLRYDIILVDSYHEYETSLRDLIDACTLLDPGGFLVVHDCLPVTFEQTSPTFRKGAWCGQSYRAYLDFLQTDPASDYCTVDTDYGCGVVRKPAQPGEKRGVRDTPVWRQWRLTSLDPHGAWQTLQQHKQELLNLVSPEEFQGEGFDFR